MVRSVFVIALLASRAAADQPVDTALQEGRTLYDLRDFAGAIEKFKESYKRSPSAAALFNIAQAYRLMGDCPNAFAYYKTFQRKYPEERDVSTFLTELEPCSKDKPGPKPAPAPVPEPAPAPQLSPQPEVPAPRPPPEEPPPAKPGRTLRIVGLTVASTGALALGTGVYFGLSARSKIDERDRSETWNPTLDATAKRHDRNMKILVASGGALIATGVVLHVLGARAAKEPQVAIVPEVGGATLVWSGGF